jgi:molybdopterin-guanine dinucleotide biosynthesis protein B
MRVVVMAGYSGAGKTTLIERLIPALQARGERVSVVKHAHHGLHIDQPGKDTWRHRQAGAFEVVAVSSSQLVLQRQFERPTTLSVHHALAELYAGVDWVLVEGFRDSNLPKLEVWRADQGHRARYPDDPFVVALCTDSPDRLPEVTQRPVLDLNDPDQVADWLRAQGERFVYDPEQFDA